jgi:hypothetical protein
MSPQPRIRQRLNVVLQMITALITAVLLGQLWLFTVTLDAMENATASPHVVIVTAICSAVACSAIWVLIRFFLKTEHAETGGR